MTTFEPLQKHRSQKRHNDLELVRPNHLHGNSIAKDVRKINEQKFPTCLKIIFRIPRHDISYPRIKEPKITRSGTENQVRIVKAPQKTECYKEPVKRNTT